MTETKIKDMHLMGLKVRDKVTKFEGVVTSENKADSRWFDTKRLLVLESTPVMEVPDFRVTSTAAVPGPEAKPERRAW